MKKLILTLSLVMAFYCSYAQLSATAPILYNSGTQVISSQAASATQDGHLLSTDWVIFNGKQPLENQRLSTSNNPTFGSQILTGDLTFTKAYPNLNLGGSGDGNINLPEYGGLIIGNGQTASFRFAPFGNNIYFQNNYTAGGMVFGGPGASYLSGDINFNTTGHINFAGNAGYNAGRSLGSLDFLYKQKADSLYAVNDSVVHLNRVESIAGVKSFIGVIAKLTTSTTDTSNNMQFVSPYGTAKIGTRPHDALSLFDGWLWLRAAGRGITLGPVKDIYGTPNVSVDPEGIFSSTKSSYFKGGIYNSKTATVGYGTSNINYTTNKNAFTVSDSSGSAGVRLFYRGIVFSQYDPTHSNVSTFRLKGDSTTNTSGNYTLTIPKATTTLAGNNFDNAFTVGQSMPSLNIGSTGSPAAKLDVTGTAMFGGSSVANLDPAAGSISYIENTGKTLIGWNRSASEGETDFIGNQGIGTSGGFAFYNHDNSGTEKQLMRIMGDGAIGIGMAYPDAKLAVNGTIHSKEVKVDLTGWPDYVFEPTYNLPSLSSVKTYIDQNHRLPEMPSIQEVLKNGVDLGEMVNLQTKKIEELTLYIIEKDEQLTEQRKTNQSYKDELRAQNEKINYLEQQLQTINQALTKNHIQ